MTYNQELYLAALRSGKYEQAPGMLRDPDAPNTFCCLGIACEVYRLETGRGRWVEGTTLFSLNEELGEGHMYGGYLPQPVLEWLEMELPFNHVGGTIDPVIGSLGRSASSMNDSGEYNFEEIADAFEFTFKGETNEK